jgi:hypothetical protein
VLGSRHINLSRYGVGLTIICGQLHLTKNEKSCLLKKILWEVTTMNLNTLYINQETLWQSLSPRQQKQLLALLEKWALRRWKTSRAETTLPVNMKGGRDEGAEQ